MSNALKAIAANNQWLYIHDGETISRYELSRFSDYYYDEMNFTYLNSSNTLDEHFENTAGMVIDSQGNLFVLTDTKVFKFTPDLGSYTTYIENITDAAGIAIDEEDRLYVLTESGTIHKWDSNNVPLPSLNLDMGYMSENSYKGLAYHNGALFAGANGPEDASGNVRIGIRKILC